MFKMYNTREEEAIACLKIRAKHPTVEMITKHLWTMQVGFHSLAYVLSYFGYSPAQVWPKVCAELNTRNRVYFDITGKGMLIQYEIDRAPWGFTAFYK